MIHDCVNQDHPLLPIGSRLPPFSLLIFLTGGSGLSTRRHFVTHIFLAPTPCYNVPHVRLSEDNLIRYCGKSCLNFNPEIKVSWGKRFRRRILVHFQITFSTNFEIQNFLNFTEKMIFNRMIINTYKNDVILTALSHWK